MVQENLARIRVAVDLIATVNLQLATGSKTTAVQPNLHYTPLISGGDGALQANRGWDHQEVLPADQTLVVDLKNLKNVDLGAGKGLDAVGQPIDYDNLVAIAVQNINPLGWLGKLEVTAASSNPWTALGEHTVANGGALSSQAILVKIVPEAAGLAIKDATSDCLQLKAVGGPVTYRLCLLARKEEPKPPQPSPLPPVNVMIEQEEHVSRRHRRHHGGEPPAPLPPATTNS